VERLPFQGGSFTGAVSTFPSEYIIDPEALHEVARVLQAAGAFVIIPAASIVGGSIGDRLVTRLLRLTGDASDFAQSITRILRTSPFTFAVERVEAEHSLVVRIVCRTPPALVTAGTSD
jgi:ubiquinone/menaquinone biosynthesis C-methylase UbiE